MTDPTERQQLHFFARLGATMCDANYPAPPVRSFLPWLLVPADLDDRGVAGHPGGASGLGGSDPPRQDRDGDG